MNEHVATCRGVSTPISARGGAERFAAFRDVSLYVAMDRRAAGASRTDLTRCRRRGGFPILRSLRFGSDSPGFASNRTELLSE